jgi:hypothetical protein
MTMEMMTSHAPPPKAVITAVTTVFSCRAVYSLKEIAADLAERRP